jgi:hypothetical protein
LEYHEILKLNSKLIKLNLPSITIKNLQSNQTGTSEIRGPFPCVCQHAV